MKQIPDLLSLRFARRAQHRNKTRKIIAMPILLDQIPAHTVARCAYTNRLQASVILKGKLIMPRGCDEIESNAREVPHCFTSRQTVRRTLETAHPKAPKRREVRGHARIVCFY